MKRCFRLTGSLPSNSTRKVKHLVKSRSTWQDLITELARLYALKMLSAWSSRSKTIPIMSRNLRIKNSRIDVISSSLCPSSALGHPKCSRSSLIGLLRSIWSAIKWSLTRVSRPSMSIWSNQANTCSPNVFLSKESIKYSSKSSSDRHKQASKSTQRLMSWKLSSRLLATKARKAPHKPILRLVNSTSRPCQRRRCTELLS